MIQTKRKLLWDTYYNAFQQAKISNISLPETPDYATKNGHMFYITTANIDQRTAIINTLKENGFYAVFHYISLHSSDYYHTKHDGRDLENSDKFTNCLLRLPMFYELTVEQVEEIVKTIV
jgi:dTDP-4-amino-4,6-dideoxygalactose transaminase